MELLTLTGEEGTSDANIRPKSILNKVTRKTRETNFLYLWNCQREAHLSASLFPYLI